MAFYFKARAVFALGFSIWAGAALAKTAEVRDPERAYDLSRPSESPQSTSQRAQYFIDSRLSVWRERLKLQDWKISAVLTRRDQLPPRTLGGVHWDKRKRTATIWILDPADYALPFGEMLNDMERTVVHELVHLELTSLPRGQASRGTAEERAVSGLADAMIALDRQERSPAK
jgi:hypothetical protein